MDVQEHDHRAEISADQLPSVNITVPWWLDIGVAIALGAILTVASNANATALCDSSASPVCPSSCAHPRPVATVAFTGCPVGLCDFTLNGKTSRAVCFRYEGSTDTAIVIYDEIFSSGFNP